MLYDYSYMTYNILKKPVFGCVSDFRVLRYLDINSDGFLDNACSLQKRTDREIGWFKLLG